MRRPSKLSTSSSTGRTNPQRSSPPTAERVRRCDAGRGAPDVGGVVGRPGRDGQRAVRREGQRRDDPAAAAPRRALPSSHTSLSPPRLTAQARRVRVASSATISTSASSGVSSSGSAPGRSSARRANSLPASQAHSTEPSGSRRAESYATSPSCGVRWVELPALGIDEEEVVVERRVRALHEDAVLRPVDRRATSRPAARARAARRRPARPTATSKSTPLRPVCVNATRVAVGRERARHVDRVRVVARAPARSRRPRRSRTARGARCRRRRARSPSAPRSARAARR